MRLFLRLIASFWVCHAAWLRGRPLIQAKKFKACLKAFEVFLRQNVMPRTVFREPIRMKKGMQTVAVTIPKCCQGHQYQRSVTIRDGVPVADNLLAMELTQYWRSSGMFVMPKTEVTNVKGRKKMETSVNSLMLWPSGKKKVSQARVRFSNVSYVR